MRFRLQKKLIKNIIYSIKGLFQNYQMRDMIKQKLLLLLQH